MGRKITKGKKLLLTLLALISVSFSQAQIKKHNVFIGPGVMMYNGDLRESFLPDPRVIHFSYTLGFGIRLNQRFGLDYRYISGKVSGNDAFAISESRKNRGFQFESIIKEHSLRLKFDFIQLGKNQQFQTAIFGGVGYFKYDPMIEVNGVMIQARPIGTEGQYLNGNYPRPYGTHSLSLPIGMEGTLAINSQWDLKGELSYHKTFTDYIDDVSGAYPKMADIENADNSALLLAATSKLEDSYPEGGMRGNPQFKDAFFNLAISVVYKFGKSMNSKKGTHSSNYGCPSF